MRADLPPVDANSTSNGAASAPFSSEFVVITKLEHIQLKTDAIRWKILHRKAVGRAQWREQRYARILRELKQRGERAESKLRLDVEELKAKVRDLQKRLFGGKSERNKGVELRVRGDVSHAHRGQQRGARGHGRTILKALPVRHEDVGLRQSHCAHCGLEFRIFPGTEDSEILEIEVKAYRRSIHRRRYRPACQCDSLPGIITAPAPVKLIARGKFGISVWTTVLLDKFRYGRPSYRLLQDFSDHGLHMSAGTLAGGLHAIAPLFEPIDKALLAKLRSEPHWHADETRWAVFVEITGKVGHRWYLWVFHSRSVVHYVLDPTRACEVIEGELAGVPDGVISCDRYSAYKKFVRKNPGVSLAYCWVHQRRDFLELANSYPDLEQWAFAWVDAIGELYHLNAVRLQAPLASVERIDAQAALELAVQQMAARRDAALAENLPSVLVCPVLQSMTVHWSGLTVFVAHPEIPMDNNVAERDMRAPVVGRKNFYGSGAQWSGELAATMYSVLQTLKLWGINSRTWLSAYLQACADNGAQPPGDINAFLPWQMDATRLAQMRAPTVAQEFDSS